MKRWMALALGAGLLLAGCGGESHQDLRAWMADQGRTRAGESIRCRRSSPTSRSRITRSTCRIPSSRARSSRRRGGQQARTGSHAPPRAARSLSAGVAQHGGNAAAGKSTYALVRTPDKDVYQVTAGNYLGQNFGVILGINESEIRLKELVQDGGGDWTERTGTLQLIQADTKTQERKK